MNHLQNEFLERYKHQSPKWGPLGWVTYVRTYSRWLEAEGRREEWWETVRRVVEGDLGRMERAGDRRPTEEKMAEAERLYHYLFHFGILVSGRNFWMSGTQYEAERGGDALVNCWWIPIRPFYGRVSYPFTFMMDRLMTGGGVGFGVRRQDIDQIPSVHNKVQLTIMCRRSHPNFDAKTMTHRKYRPQAYLRVPDTREGWCQALAAVIESHFTGTKRLAIDISDLRPYGAPIKGFGGTASGPAPLVSLLLATNQTLNARSGGRLTSVDCLDLGNYIGRCVVSGNVRRSAEIAVGDADDLEFIQAKRDREKLFSHRWASNNTVMITADEVDFEQIAGAIADNGEPGIFNIDLAKNYGRIMDGRQPDIDREADGLNPCLTGDSLLLTDKGLRRIDSLVDEPFQVWDGTAFTSASAWLTGTKEAFLVKLSNGQTFKATADHKVMLADGSWEVVGDLLGQEIQPMAGANWEGTEYGTRAMEFLGYMQGDGTIDEARSKVYVNIGKNDAELIDTFNLRGYAKEPNSGKAYAWYVPTPAWRELNVIGVKSLPIKDRDLPEALFTAAPKSVAAFLRGLYAANGSVVRNRVTLKSINRNLIEQVQLLLQALGIRSYITTNRRRDVAFANGTYTCRESYDLNTTSDSVKVFAAKIGFLHGYKQEKLAAAAAAAGKHTRLPKVVSVESIGHVPVYDFTSPVTHYGWVQGLPIHNCGEITLAPGEPCNLCDVNPFVIHRDGATLGMTYEEALRLAARYTYRVTCAEYHHQLTQEIVARNRRTGVALTGLQDWILARFGRPAVVGFADDGEPRFDPEVVAELDRFYRIVRAENDRYAEALGLNPSIKTTTIKPSGTVSLLAGVSPGVHAPYSAYYIRRIRFQQDDPLVKLLRLCGLPVEPDQYTPNTVVVEFPIMSPAAYVPGFKSADALSIEEQLAVQYLLAYAWADNAVSCTVVFRGEEKPKIAGLLRQYRDRLKSTSLLPYSDHGYVQAPYEPITQEEFERRQKAITMSPEEMVKLYPLEDLKEMSDLDLGECVGGACPIK